MKLLIFQLYNKNKCILQTKIHLLKEVHFCLADSFFQSAHPRGGGDDPFRFFHDHIDVSIRAPAIGTMTTHSKIRQVRALATPLSAQNRHNLGNPFPPPHPCDRSLRKKTSRFYDHLRFALECFLAHLTIICVAVAKFRSPPLNDLLLVYLVTQPSDGFDLAAQSIASPSLSFGPSTKLHSQKV